MIQLEYRDGQWYEVAGDTQKPVDIDTYTEIIMGKRIVWRIFWSARFMEGI